MPMTVLVIVALTKQRAVLVIRGGLGLELLFQQRVNASLVVAEDVVLLHCPIGGDLSGILNKAQRVISHKREQINQIKRMHAPE